MMIERVDVDGENLQGLVGFYVQLRDSSHSVVILYRSRHGYFIKGGGYFEEIFSKQRGAVVRTPLDSFGEIEKIIGDIETSNEPLFCEAYS